MDNYLEDITNWKIEYYISDKSSDIQMEASLVSPSSPKISFQACIVYIIKEHEYNYILGVDVNFHMPKFYNYFQKDLRPLFDILPANIQQNVKGLSYSLLCYLLNYQIRNGFMTEDDLLYISASGSTFRREPDLIGLHDFYKSIGFKSSDKYMNKYKEVVQNIRNGKYTRDEYNVIRDAEIEPFYSQLDALRDLIVYNKISKQKYKIQKDIILVNQSAVQLQYPDMNEIPMYAQVKDLLNICTIKSKHKLTDNVIKS